MLHEFPVNTQANSHAWGDTAVPATGRGGIMGVRLNFHSKSVTAIIGDVLYVPDLGFNLLSIHKMTESGLQVTFEATSCIVRSKCWYR